MLPTFESLKAASLQQSSPSSRLGTDFDRAIRLIREINLFQDVRFELGHTLVLTALKIRNDMAPTVYFGIATLPIGRNTGITGNVNSGTNERKDADRLGSLFGEVNFTVEYEWSREPDSDIPTELRTNILCIIQPSLRDRALFLKDTAH